MTEQDSVKNLLLDFTIVLMNKFPDRRASGISLKDVIDTIEELFKIEH